MKSVRKTGALSLLALMAAAAFIFQSNTASAESIGIAPTNFDFESLARGQEYARTINVFHDSENDRSFQFGATGELAEWISFFDIETGEPVEIYTVAHQGSRSKGSVGIRLTVPEEASNGFYSGTVQVAGVVAGQAPGSSAATVGASISVFADVTGDQVLSGSLLEASAISIEEGFTLRIDTRLDNSGNVSIIPEFSIVIEDVEGNELLTADATVDQIGPQELAARGFELNVDQLQPGDYVARVSAQYRELDLGASLVRFSVVERGTLTRDGVLTGITLLNEPIAGEVARIQVDFQNTGQIEANAVFIGEINRDGQFVDVVTSLPQLVTAGQLGQIEAFVDVDEVGMYTVSGKVNFDGKESQPVEISFEVPAERVIVEPTSANPVDNTGGTDPAPGGDSGGNSNIALIALIALIVVLIGGAGFVGYRRGWRMPQRRRPSTLG